MRIIWPRSLTARILAMELIILGSIVAVVPPLTISILSGSVARYQNDTLRAQARAVAEAIRPTPGGGIVADLNPLLKPIFDTGYDGRAYLVVGQRGGLLIRSLFGSPGVAMQAPRRSQLSNFQTRNLVGVSMPVRLGSRPLWVIVTQDQAQPGVILDDVVREFLRKYLIVLLPLLVLLPILNSLIIRQLVLVVRRVSGRAAAIDARNLHDRLPTTGLPTEIAPLVQAANGLLERLETSFRQQKEFSGNVAHELRTPLATLQLSLDAIEDRKVREPLSKQVVQLSHAISQLRDLAAIDSSSRTEFMPVDLNELAVEVVASVAPTIVAGGRSIALDDAGRVMVAGNPTMIRLALTNLLDNAMRYTPTGSSITVAIDRDGTLRVVDDGPGIVAENLDLLVQRYWRAGAARSDNAGIGLSIVQQIVDVHRGTLKISNVLPHGACFEMSFERACDGTN